jgi:hypothetical protein
MAIEKPLLIAAKENPPAPQKKSAAIIGRERASPATLDGGVEMRFILAVVLQTSKIVQIIFAT